MSSYLEEAAEQYRKALAEIDGAFQFAETRAECRVEIADKLAALGAIEAGVVPAALLRDLLHRILEEAQRQSL